MSHRETEIVPDRGSSDRKGALSLNSFASVWNAKYAIISRGAESAWRGVQFKEVMKVRRSNAGDHSVAHCISLVFCSAFH